MWLDDLEEEKYVQGWVDGVYGEFICWVYVADIGSECK